MTKEEIAIGSLLSIPIALVIDFLALPDPQTISSFFKYLTVISNFTTSATNITATTTAFSNGIIGLVCFLLIFAVTDVITSGIIYLLTNMRHTVGRF